MKTTIDALVEALEGLLADYVCIAESGDCGNWDAEEQPGVIKARAALAQARAEQAEPVAKLEPLKDDEIFCALNETAMGAQSRAGYPAPNVLVELVRATEAAHNAKLAK